MKNRFQKFGIATQISFIFSALIIILLFSILTVFLYEQQVLIKSVAEFQRANIEKSVDHEKIKQYKGLDKQATFFNRIIARSISDYLYDLDITSSETILKAFMEPNWIEAIVVIDEYDQVFSSVWRKVNGEIECKSVRLPKYISKKVLMMKNQGSFHKNKKIGEVKLYYTDMYLKKDLENMKKDTLNRLIEGEKKAYHHLRKVIFIQLAVACIGILTILLVILMKGRSIADPILRMASCIDELGKNNLNAYINEEDMNRRDELGTMARGYEITRSNLFSIISGFSENAKNLALASEQLTELSSTLFLFSEDMSRDSVAVVENAEENGNYVTSIAQSTSQISETVNVINERIAQLSTNIGTVASSASEASLNMSEITKNIENISKDINTVNNSIETMSSNLSSVSRSSSETVKISEEANDQINKSLAMLTKLQKASEEIHGAVQIISTISSQTNLLALNATIEAVRGGEAGIRFGVVAEEVKNLAKKTSDANNDIGKLIGEIREYVNITVESIQETSQVIGKVLENNIVIGESINRQSDASNAITMSVDSIAKATEESAQKVKNANEGLKDIKTSATEVASVAKESAVNISEAAIGISEIAQSSEVVSQGITKLINDMKNIQYATYNITDVASGNKQNSIELSKLAEELKKAVTTFNIG